MSNPFLAYEDDNTALNSPAAVLSRGRYDGDGHEENLDDPRGPDQQQGFAANINKSNASDHRITMDDIAQQLLQDNFILTALELHTEIQEIGKELPRLRDYFSNPGNFERAKPPEIQSTSPPVSLQRSGSIQTFDSLDWARYSDDGDRQVEDRVAGLEFELRKATDTIKSLRKALTVATEKESVTTADDQMYSNQERESADIIKPHEKRAINFLLNEYLLLHDYKLTSVTFAEENENQDFENWDDVGLNIAKPPDLLHLYADYGHHITPTTNTNEAETCVNFYQAEVDAMQEELSAVSEQFQNSQTEMEKLNQTIQSLKSESDEVRKALADTEERLIEEQQARKQVLTTNISQLPDTKLVNNDEMDPPVPEQWHHQPVNRTIPDQFITRLINLTFHIPEHNRIAHEVSLLDKTSIDSIVNMLAHSIPNIVPNVLLAKREELLPLILCAANLHGDVKTRDTMLNILFNLIKKPDDEQRQMILAGCVMFAQCNGPTKVEEELLPQCWEQINDKYQERRLLVANACGALIPYMSNEMRSSLVLSMLQQMMMDEKVEEVRAAVIRSLGVLTSFMDDTDKYPQVLSLYTRILCDNATVVQTEAVSILLPSLALWSLELGRLSDITEAGFIALNNSLTEPNDENQIFMIEEPFLATIQHLQTLVNFQYVAMVMNGPYAEQDATPNNGAEFSSLESAGGLADIDCLTIDDEEFQRNVAHFHMHTSEEWYKTWDEFDLLIYTTFSKLTMFLLSVHPKDCSVLPNIIHYCNSICRAAGKGITEEKIETKIFDLLRMDADTTSNQHQKMFTSCLLPLLVCGVMASFQDDDSTTKLCDYTKRVIIMMCEWDIPQESVEATITNLLSRENTLEPVLDMLWELVVHPSMTVRATIAKHFQLCATCLGCRSEISTKILPALVTLARDPEISVRSSTVQPFGTILSASSNREVLDKVYMEFVSLMDEPSNFNDCDILMVLVKTFSVIGPHAEPPFRDEVILPRLTGWAAANNSCADTIRRSNVAQVLLEAYSALSCCFINDQVMREIFQPGLHYLITDLKELALDGLDIIQSMIKDFEAKNSNVMGETSASVGEYNATPKGYTKQTMFNKLKDFKEKSAPTKMTSLFTKKK